MPHADSRRPTCPCLPRQAVAVFVNHVECFWLRGLRPGFRHCFVAIRDHAGWLICDPLKDRIELSALPLSAQFDLPGFYANCGYTVLFGRTKPSLPRRPFSLAPLTCVTIAKRVLGVRARWVMTPWQLCRHLTSEAHGFQIRRSDPTDQTTTPGINVSPPTKIMVDRSTV